MEWLSLVAFIGIGIGIGSAAMGYLTRRGTRLFDIFRYNRKPAMFPFYGAMFVVFLSKGLMAEPLAHAWPGQVERPPALPDIVLDAVLLTMAVAGPVMEGNRRWMVRLRWDVTGVRLPLGTMVLILSVGWFPIMAMTTFGFWAHDALTGQDIVLASALLSLSLVLRRKSGT